MTSLIILTPKRHFLTPKHVVWAIKRENRFIYSTWARSREKKRQARTVEKSHKLVIFRLYGEKPPLYRLEPKFACGWPPWRNYVCKVSSWYFYGLRFYRGSNFSFSYWFWHGPYNSAALSVMYPIYAIQHTERNTNDKQISHSAYFVDLLVLIELLSLVVTAEELRANIDWKSAFSL